jgi:hypothetical protein
VANQQPGFAAGAEPRAFQPAPDVVLLERFLAWLREMRQATATGNGA